MNKDVIYIDVDDDITAIIGKVKASKEKIVALVPPKRIGVLQSAVNLRLLQRTATNGKKHLVLISSNPALMALAASAKLPVAKNIQSKPEVPEIAALDIDDGEDVINGDELPVGDHARTADLPGDESEADKAAGALMAKKAAPPVSGEAPKKPSVKKGPKVPNFNTFRKKLVIIIAAAVLLLGFLVWAIFFAPRATVVITARTTDKNVSKEVALNPAATTSFSAGTIKAIRQEQKKPQAVEFTATGQKDVGSKATGTVTFSTQNIDNLGMTIPAGTQLTSSSGLVFVTNQSVTFTLSNYKGASVGVSAAENGEKYNAATGSLSGAPSDVSAKFTGPTSGGTTKMVTIVTAADVQKAAEQLASQEDPAIKAQLKTAFGGDVYVIDTSYSAVKSDPVSTPAVGQEATKARLTTEITYSMYGVAKTELKKYLDAAVKDSISDQPDQRVYDNGSQKASFTDFKNDNGARARLVANGKVGPQIKDEDIKEKVKGKQFGDIQADIEAIQGVEDVDVKFFPFWVRTVPGDTKKITVEFKINGEQ
jgi:hypothetical protein